MSRLRKLANLSEELGEEYSTASGKVTPYHILFKDNGDEIASMDVEAAIQFCSTKIDDLNEQYKSDPSYYMIIDQEKEEFLQSLRDCQNGMDVVFTIKDYLLRADEK
ncbi:gp592 [Bacillus phage G]|uniref:Gp592 n=1 Tax=Bacillus phage G TaxID=2884420 RepID=G3MAX2_9CAUD|nr:gp592 [Bacillus phage G]AEO93837.1 gp592 [Bacillus phage G]